MWGVTCPEAGVMSQEQCFGILGFVESKEQLDSEGRMPGTITVFVPKGSIWVFSACCESSKCFEANSGRAGLGFWVELMGGVFLLCWKTEPLDCCESTWVWHGSY